MKSYSIKSYKAFRFENWHIFAMLLILSVAFVIRIINLNYNIPFNDEAIYIVLGKLGVFQWDWWSYNAAAWMAGYPYVYPVMTALAYVTGGIIGSRLLNVVFGVLTVEGVYLLTVNILHKKDNHTRLAGVISAVIAGGASVGLYVSRLATLDMPSFYFLCLGLVFLLIAEHPNRNTGKWYFFSAFFLILSFLCKIVTGMYIPLIIAFSILKVKNKAPEYKKYWLIYFISPIVLTILFYVLGNAFSLTKYASHQVLREKISYLEIIKIFWDNSFYAWLLYFPASLGLFLSKQWRIWLSLTLASLVILIFHIALHRYQTLDKHTFLAVLCLSPVIGIGLSNLAFIINNQIYRTFALFIISVILVVFFVVSYLDAQKYNMLWDNAGVMLTKLAGLVRPGDKVLVEVGAAGILATYDRNYPTNTITFDWFEYRKIQGDEAYVAALKDGYFDYIELEREDRPEDSTHKKMHKLIKTNLAGNYKVIFSKKGFFIYQRVF